MWQNNFNIVESINEFDTSAGLKYHQANEWAILHDAPKLKIFNEMALSAKGVFMHNMHNSK